MIGNKYNLIEQIGKGSFGEIYKGINTLTKEIVAIKIEPHVNETKLLKNETKIYQYLNNMQGIPQVKWYGADDVNNYMVMTYLGISLSSYINKNGVFSFITMKEITRKILKIVKNIHDKGLIHRDIKPDNFLFGSKSIDNIYLIDFGFCKRYIDDDGKHIECNINKSPVGTLNYISINIHNGLEASRRDDLESIGYVMLYMLYGNLEWNELNNYINYRNVNGNIKVKKITIINNDNIPILIKEYLSYCNKLKFDEKPNYEYLFNLLK